MRSGLRYSVTGLWPLYPARTVGAFFDNGVEVFIPDQGRHYVLVAFVPQILDLVQSRDRTARHQVFEMGMADSEHQDFHV
jgi:hypothetical protein